MPLVEYVPRNFQGVQARLIAQANAVIEDWMRQGYRLTLRQLYYRLVSANVIPNTFREYKNLGALIVNARRAGLVDWDALEDRTRNLMAMRNWPSPSDAIGWLAEQYHTDMWENQPHRVEVWFEKDALAGIFERACNALDVPFFSCRGYNSESEMWGAAMRLREYAEERGQAPIVLHFSDHDPSGLDMTHDIMKRMNMFGLGDTVDVRRCALTIVQVKRHRLPPNPARETDTRFRQYRRQYGKHSWELDALEPSVLSEIVRTNVLRFREESLWKKAERREKRERGQLARLSRVPWKKLAKVK